jgi:hypothetical protein
VEFSEKLCKDLATVVFWAKFVWLELRKIRSETKFFVILQNKQVVAQMGLLNNTFELKI